MADTMVELIEEDKDITTHLLDSEKRRLQECEQVIHKGLNTFLEVGHALAEIRDNRLYRESHKTFEKYCKEVWDLSKGYATRQICGYETVNLLESKMVPIGTISESDSENLDSSEAICRDCEYKKGLNNRAFKGVKIPNGSGKCVRDGGLCDKKVVPEHSDAVAEIILPINEAQTRPLTELKNPDDVVEAWKLVLEQLNDGKKLTASLVKNIVKQVKGEVVKKTVKKAKKSVENKAQLSPIYQRQYQVLVDIVSGERDSNYATSSPKQIVKSLKSLIQIVEMDQ